MTGILIFFDTSLNDLFEDSQKQKNKKNKEKDFPTISVQKRKMDKLMLHRCVSEKAMDDQLDWHFEQGYEYHFISHGDVDSLSFLPFILKQQKIHKCILSTWVMAQADIDELDNWLTRGLIKKLDVYVGEIFHKNDCYVSLKKALKKHKCGKVHVFRNHSKVMVGYGDRFDFVIESSANINTNPRTEQTSIFISTKLADFYKKFFEGVQAFNKWEQEE